MARGSRPLGGFAFQSPNPKHVTAARELRDRYMEQINSHSNALLAQGKYGVVRTLDAPKAEHRQGSATLALASAA